MKRYFVLFVLLIVSAAGALEMMGRASSVPELRDCTVEKIIAGTVYHYAEAVLESNEVLFIVLITIGDERPDMGGIVKSLKILS
jgi:hypothetical protein